MTELGAAQIERIVREVLAEMGAAPNATADARRGRAPETPPKTAARLHVAGHVVAAAAIAGRLDGVREIVVGRRAVVTPAALDLLRPNNIAIVREEAPAAAGETAHGALAVGATATPVRAPARVCLISATRSFGPEPLAANLQTDGLAVCFQQKDCLIASAEELARNIADGRTVGVLVTRKAAAALCLANRKPGVRAILAAGPDALQRDADEVGANALIVDPRGRGLYALRRMVRRFAGDGVRACPEVFEKPLG